MDSLEFECPLCNGLFSAAVTEVEIACPHCDEKICLGAFDTGSSENVTLVAKRITTPAPLFPPGYKRPAASDLSAPPVTKPDELPPVVIIDVDVDKSVDDIEPETPIVTEPDELTPVVIIDDDVEKPVDDIEPVAPPPAEPDELPPVVIIDDDVDKSVDDIEAVGPPPTLPDTVIDDEVDESSVSTETDTAIDDLLPPDFHLDDAQIETRTDHHEITETPVIVNVRVEREPITVGRGINKRELRSRTPDEKNQFMRKKNVIVWVIGALTIIVTMIVMLQLA